MSLCKKIINKIAEGRRFPFKARMARHIVKKTTTGAPNTAAPVGTICYNSYDGDAYICTVAAGTWVKINA